MRITNPSNVPPGGAFIYVQPESGMTFRHHAMMHLLGMVKSHRMANNYPIGSGFEQEVIDYICEHQPDICESCDPPQRPTKATLMLKFARAIGQWALSGFKLVDEETFANRKLICQECPYWAGDGALFNLGKCSRCGCSSLKIHVATEKCPINKW